MDYVIFFELTTLIKRQGRRVIKEEPERSGDGWLPRTGGELCPVFGVRPRFPCVLFCRRGFVSFGFFFFLSLGVPIRYS